jgi:hypothetical protein
MAIYELNTNELQRIAGGLAERRGFVGGDPVADWRSSCADYGEKAQRHTIAAIDSGPFKVEVDMLAYDSYMQFLLI